MGDPLKVLNAQVLKEGGMNPSDELAEIQRLAHIGSWYCDAKTGENTASSELCRIFGRENIPPFAEQCGTLYPADAWHDLNAAVQEALRIGTGYDLELPALREDGTPIWVNVRCASARNELGEIACLRGTVQDITDHKRVEMALQESKRLLEFTMQLSHTGGWDFDLIDHTAHRTEGHDRIFGYESTLPEWNYDIFLEHVIPDDRAEVDRLLREAVAGESDWNFECRIRRTDGEVRWILAAGGYQHDDKGAVRRMSGIVQDITASKRMDQALHEKNIELEKSKAVAEKANLAKSVFLSNMSHELRTPLNAILGFAQLLEQGSPTPTDSQHTRLNQIIKSGWYLLELINEILDISAIESGHLSLLQEAVPLLDVMRECQTMIEPQAQKSGIQINFLPFDGNCYVHADRTRVKQALINLLSNAIKYNRKHGTVEVKCTCTTERIRISIKDSGAGLSAEQLEQLFQPFNRLGQENSSEEGTGIGLVVTKQLVELMGGTISVESTVGVGSEFCIELIRDVTPQLVAKDALPEEPAEQATGRRPLRTLLYVEDNPANLMLVEQIIEGHPHVRMLSAKDGYHGMELARVHLPDVILMDINLPGISGIEALNILREDLSTKHIPVIALSANAMLHDIEQGLGAGFFHYLTKPIKVTEFMRMLNVALEFAENGRQSGSMKQKKQQQ